MTGLLGVHKCYSLWGPAPIPPVHNTYVFLPLLIFYPLASWWGLPGKRQNGTRSLSVHLSVNTTTTSEHHTDGHRAGWGPLASNWARAEGDFLRNCNSKLRGKSQLYLRPTEARADHWQQPVGHLPRAQNIRGTITSLGVYQDGKKTCQPETAPDWKKHFGITGAISSWPDLTTTNNHQPDF